MPRAEYPNGNDLSGLLTSLNLFDATELATFLVDMDLDTLVQAAATQFEMESGWIPFLGDSSDVTRYFDPAGPNQRLPGSRGGSYLLSLNAGLLTVTSFHAGFSGSSVGTALVSEDDYRLRPLNAVVENRPYTEIELLSGWTWGLGRSLRIIGRWGYGVMIPDDVWLAILHQAGNLALPILRERLTGGLVEWKEADAMERYGDAFLTGDGSAGGRWMSEWSRIILRYRRVVI